MKTGKALLLRVGNLARYGRRIGTHLYGRLSLGVAYVTLNRPEVYNAYNGELIAALLAAFVQLGREATHAAVITGKGRNFQAGADINWLDSVRRLSPQDNLHASRMTAEAIQRLNMLSIPTVALVQGACFGDGTGIIAACDIVIAADNALFSIAEVRIGGRANFTGAVLRGGG